MGGRDARLRAEGWVSGLVMELGRPASNFAPSRASLWRSADFSPQQVPPAWRGIHRAPGTASWTMPAV